MLKYQTSPTPKITREDIESEFEPSMKALFRIMKVMSEQGSVHKTGLALYSKMNYSRLKLHIVWLERKGLIESVINEGKVNLVLTTNGRLFNNMLSP